MNSVTVEAQGGTITVDVASPIKTVEVVIPAGEFFAVEAENSAIAAAASEAVAVASKAVSVAKASEASAYAATATTKASEASSSAASAAASASATQLALGSKVSKTGPESITANSAQAALTITQTSTGNALVVEDQASDTTPFVVNNTGRVIIGGGISDLPDYSGTNRSQQLSIEAESYAGTSVAIVANVGVGAGGPTFNLAKSRGTNAAPNTVVAANDILGAINLLGNDGSGFIRAAQISGQVDGTPGTNDMPGRLVFSTTADGASIPTERMRIGSDGRLVLAAASGLTIGRTAVTAPAATDGNVFSGTYTPTLTNVSNLDASTAVACQYMRVGNTVTVSGYVSVDPTTATGTLTRLGISLPVASNLGSVANCCGTAANISATASNSCYGCVYGDTTNDRAVLDFNAPINTVFTVQFHFTYQVI